MPADKTSWHSSQTEITFQSTCDVPPDLIVEDSIDPEKKQGEGLTGFIWYVIMLHVRINSSHIEITKEMRKCWHIKG